MPMMGMCAGMNMMGMSAGGKASGKGKSKSSAPRFTPYEEYVPPPADSMPEVVWLQIDADSQLAQAGYPLEGAAIEHQKLDVFSDAHYWCQEFFQSYLKDEVTISEDWNGVKFPEIRQAWKSLCK